MGVQFLEALTNTLACLTHRTQFHVTLYTRARVRASRKVTTTCVRCVRPCAKARGPISVTQPENQPQTRTSIEFLSLAVFRIAWVQTCKPGTHPGSHHSHYSPSRIGPRWPGFRPAGPQRRVRTANPANLVFWSDGGALLRLRPPYCNIARKDPFRLGHHCFDRP